MTRDELEAMAKLSNRVDRARTRVATIAKQLDRLADLCDSRRIPEIRQAGGLAMSATVELADALAALEGCNRELYNKSALINGGKPFC